MTEEKFELLPEIETAVIQPIFTHELDINDR
jgi:hypothetical protein